MKTIDVMEGDEFVADKYLCQIRGGMFRNFWAGGVSGWSKGGRLAENPKLRPVSTDDARLILETAGYTLTRGEGEKPECQQKTTSPVLTAEASGNARLVKETPPDFPTANSGKAELPKPAPQENKDGEKSCIRNVVPVVDAVARANADSIAGAIVHIQDRLYALESRLAALEQPAPKPASRVVKAPKMEPLDYGDRFDKGRNFQDWAWRAALASQGFTVADEGSSK